MNIKGEIDGNISTVEDFNTTLTLKDRSFRQKISKETATLNNTLYQMDLNNFRTFHLKAAENTFFSSAHESFSKIDHMLGHKTSINKVKKS